VRVSSKAKPKTIRNPVFSSERPQSVVADRHHDVSFGRAERVSDRLYDDYSRYVVGLGAYRSQTAENVLETVKIAFGEYGIPREMLSDNGRPVP